MNSLTIAVPVVTRRWSQEHERDQDGEQHTGVNYHKVVEGRIPLNHDGEM